MIDLHQRRRELEAEIEATERAQAEAMLDGGRPQKLQGDLTRAKNELHALTRAEGIQADRNRELAEHQRLARKAMLQSELAALEIEYYDVIERIEMNLRNVVDGLNQAFDLAKRMEKTAHLITGSTTPTALGSELPKRLARRLAALMGAVKGHSIRLGHLHWTNTGLHRAEDDWRVKEQKAIQSQLAPIIAGALPKPREKLLQIEHQKEPTINVTSGKNAA
jgi:hypothetical protein